MTSPPPKRALDRGALIPPREAPAPFPDSAFVAPDRALDVACHALERRSITNESPDVLRQLKNIHTLFFIPMQWFAVGAGVVIFFGALSTALR